MPDTTIIPALIRESAPRHATRLDMVSATRRSQGLHSAAAHEHCVEAFEAADDLLRALKRFLALPTNRPDEMKAWLWYAAGGAIDQLGNVKGTIDKELDEQGLYPTEPLDLSELETFWRSVDSPSPAQTKGEG